MSNPNKESKMIKTLPAPSDAAAAGPAGVFNKVSRKPTNHSKNMSRSKSKNKVKETRKMKNGSGGVGSNSTLVSKRVVDSSPGLHNSGFLDDVEKKNKEEDDGGGVDENGPGLIMDNPPEIGSGDVKDNIKDNDVGLVWEDVDEDEGWVKL